MGNKINVFEKQNIKKSHKEKIQDKKQKHLSYRGNHHGYKCFNWFHKQKWGMPRTRFIPRHDKKWWVRYPDNIHQVRRFREDPTPKQMSKDAPI